MKRQYTGKSDDSVQVRLILDSFDSKPFDGVMATEHFLHYLEEHFGKEAVTINDMNETMLDIIVDGYSGIAVDLEVRAGFSELGFSAGSKYMVKDLQFGDLFSSTLRQDDETSDISFEGEEEDILLFKLSKEEEKAICRKEIPLWPDSFHIGRSKGAAQVVIKLEGLIGVKEFKRICKDIISIAESSERESLCDYFQRAAVCFSINNGCGFSKLTGLLGRVLEASGAKNIRIRDEYPELKKNSSKKEVFEAFTRSDNDDGIVTYDLSFKMDEAQSGEFRDFLRELRDVIPEGVLPVFKIPYLEGESKERMKHVLSSVFPMIFIDVPPYSLYEYTEFAREMARDWGYTFDRKATDEMEKLIIYEQSKMHFLGLKSIKNLVNDIIYRKNLIEAGKGKKMSLKITEADLRPMLERLKTEEGGLEALDEMIGVDEIKSRIDEIVAQLELAANMSTGDRPCMNMLFTGNPGTGKTTIARILGRVLKEKGVLSKGQFFERTGRDFVGRYIGETAPKTNAICRDAYGSILFIDEAYTLFRTKGDDKDFGREAIDTLITQMENHRQDFIVILSGYPEQMKLMLEANPGLASRIPHELKFRNFTREELAGIFINMTEKKYEVSDDLKETVENYFKNLSNEILEESTFANARFVRNLYERTVSKVALRISGETGERIRPDTHIVITAADFIRASESEEFTKLQEKKKYNIGFN